MTAFWDRTLRKLKRRGQGAIAGVYFRIRDDEIVWVGHYGSSHRPKTAVEAAAEFSASESREGWEVIIPRRIAAKEIHRIRSLPQLVGWRFFPDAKGKPPFCTCKYCTRGEHGAARLRARLGSTNLLDGDPSTGRALLEGFHHDATAVGRRG